MSDCADRLDDYSRAIDDLDKAIAALIKARDERVKSMPNCYDSCGEGEAYFSIFELGRAEDIYFTVAEL